MVTDVLVASVNETLAALATLPKEVQRSRWRRNAKRWPPATTDTRRAGARPAERKLQDVIDSSLAVPRGRRRPT